MDLFGDNSPIRCHAVGLDCETCVTRSAREIAACCASLKGVGLIQIFRSLYPSTGCAPMGGFFEDAYIAALQPNTAAAAA